MESSVFFTDGLVKIFAVSSYSIRRPGSPVSSIEKKPVRSETRAAFGA